MKISPKIKGQQKGTTKLVAPNNLEGTAYLAEAHEFQNVVVWGDLTHNKGALLGIQRRNIFETNACGGENEDDGWKERYRRPERIEAWGKEKMLVGQTNDANGKRRRKGGVVTLYGWSHTLGPKMNGCHTQI